MASASLEPDTTTGRLRKADLFLTSVPMPVFFLALVLITTLKAGPYFGHNFRSEMLSDSAIRPDFPAILLDPSLSLAVVLRITTRPGYELFAIALGFAVFVTIALLVRRYADQESQRWVLPAVILSPVGALLVLHFGRYDTIFLLGAFVALLAGRRSMALLVIGSLVMALGNPGQSLVTSGATLILSLIPALSEWRRVAVVMLTASAVWLAAATVIGRVSNEATQITYLPMTWQESSIMLLRSLPTSAYSIYGIGWLIVLAGFFTFRGWRAFPLFVAAVLIPMTFMGITTDGTRVGIGVGIGPIMVLTLILLPKVRAYVTRRDIAGAFTLFVVLAVICPTPEVSHGMVVTPWDWTVHEIDFWWQVLRGS